MLFGTIKEAGDMRLRYDEAKAERPRPSITPENRRLARWRLACTSPSALREGRFNSESVLK